MTQITITIDLPDNAALEDYQRQIETLNAEFTALIGLSGSTQTAGGETLIERAYGLFNQTGEYLRLRNQTAPLRQTAEKFAGGLIQEITAQHRAAQLEDIAKRAAAIASQIREEGQKVKNSIGLDTGNLRRALNAALPVGEVQQLERQINAGRQAIGEASNITIDHQIEHKGR